MEDKFSEHDDVVPGIGPRRTKRNDVDFVNRANANPWNLNNTARSTSTDKPFRVIRVIRG